jgi:hypothetical protein
VNRRRRRVRHDRFSPGTNAPECSSARRHVCRRGGVSAVRVRRNPGLLCGYARYARCLPMLERGPLAARRVVSESCSGKGRDSCCCQRALLPSSWRGSSGAPCLGHRRAQTVPPGDRSARQFVHCDTSGAEIEGCTPESGSERVPAVRLCGAWASSHAAPSLAGPAPVCASRAGEVPEGGGTRLAPKWAAHHRKDGSGIQGGMNDA